MPLLPAGKYIAKTFKPESVTALSGITVYETGRGALCLAVPCEVAEGEHAGKQLKSTQTLFKADGSIMQKTVDTLKEVFNWDGQTLPWFATVDLSECRFEIVVEDEQGEKDGQPMTTEAGEPILFSKVAWINPLGGGLHMPPEGDTATLQAKFGSMLRANSGGAPVKPAAKPKAPAGPPPARAAAKPKSATKPPPPAGPVSTMEAAWDALTKAQAGKSEAEVGELWYHMLQTKFGTKDNSKITPQQWGELLASITDDVPY